MTGMQEQWQKISENLRGVLNPGIFKVWIHPLDAHIEGNSLCLAAPSEYVARWLRDRMQDTLRSAAAPVLQVAPENIDIRISCQGAAPAPAAPAAPAAVAAAPLATPLAQPVHEVPATPLHTAPSRPSQPLWQPSQCSLPLPAPTLRPRTRQRWRFSFDDFVVGPCNAMAVAAAKDICHDGGCVETLFVSSASGLGKTHIMQSVGRAVQEQGGQARLAYLSAEDLASRYVAALRSNDVESFRARLRDLDVLLLEDVHFLQGKEKMQDMVLTVIKSLQDRGGRAIFTSSFSPRELEKLDSQLVSHFCSGIVSPLERPDTEMCRHILERKAKSFQVLLPDEVCDLLAGRLQGDVRQLESCLKSLVFKARMLNCGLNPELALEVLQHSGLTDLIVVITRYFGGVLLGTGGLVRAYTTATARALENAEVVTVRSVVELRMTVDYSLYERASLLIDAAGAKQAAPEFADRVTLRWQMPEHTEGPLLEQLRELTRGGAEAAVSEPFYAPF